MERLQRFSIRKLSIGAVSCVIGTVAFLSYSNEVKAAENTDTSLKIVETNSANNSATSNVNVDNTNKQAVVNTSDQSKSEDSSAVAPTSEKTQLQAAQDSSIKVKENNLNNDKSDTTKAVAKPTNLNDENNSRDPDSKDIEVKPKESSNVDTNEQNEKKVTWHDTFHWVYADKDAPNNKALHKAEDDLAGKKFADDTVLTITFTPKDGKYTSEGIKISQTGAKLNVDSINDLGIKTSTITNKPSHRFSIYFDYNDIPVPKDYELESSGFIQNFDLDENDGQISYQTPDSEKTVAVYKRNSQTVSISYVDDDENGNLIWKTDTSTVKEGQIVNTNIQDSLKKLENYILVPNQNLPETITVGNKAIDPIVVHLKHKTEQRNVTKDFVQSAEFTLSGSYGAILSDPTFSGHGMTTGQALFIKGTQKYDLVTESYIGEATWDYNHIYQGEGYDADATDDATEAKDLATINSLEDLNKTYILGGSAYYADLPDKDLQNEDLQKLVVHAYGNGDTISTQTWLKDGLHADGYYLSEKTSYVYDNNSKSWMNLIEYQQKVDPNFTWTTKNAPVVMLGDHAVDHINPEKITSELLPKLDPDLSYIDVGDLDGRAILLNYVPYRYKQHSAQRTINIHLPNGEVKTVSQKADAKQPVFTVYTMPDARNNKLASQETGNWTGGEWAEYDAPVVAGYTASQPTVSAKTVTGDTQNETIDITYVASEHTSHVKLVDNDNKTIQDTPVMGKTGETANVSVTVPKGWQLVSGQELPTQISFNAEGHPDVVVQIEHKTIKVTSDNPKENGTVLPDNPSVHFNGVSHDDLNKTITREITITDPSGEKTTRKQTVTFTRDATVDEVTGKVTYGTWSENGKHIFDEVNVPYITGYRASEEVPEVTVTPDSKSNTVNVTYVAKTYDVYIFYQKVSTIYDNDSSDGSDIIFYRKDFDKYANGKLGIAKPEVLRGHYGESINIPIKQVQGYHVDPYRNYSNYKFGMDSITGQELSWYDFDFNNSKDLKDPLPEDASENEKENSMPRFIFVDYIKDHANSVYNNSGYNIGYVDTEGAVIGRPTNLRGISGTDTNFIAPTFEGYTLTNPQEVPEKFDKTSKDIFLVYKPQDVKVTYHYVDETGKELVPSYVENNHFTGLTHVDQTNAKTIPGYSLVSTPEQTVVDSLKDLDLYFTYKANDGSQTISYQDNGQEVGKQVITGKTDQTVKVTPEVPDGYVVKSEIPKEVTIRAKDDAIVIVVEHGKAHISPDKPVNKGDLIEGTKDKHYPSGLTHDDLNKTITRKVTIVDPTGKKTITMQTVTFTRDATVDEVTGKVTYGNWSENGQHTFDKVEVPTISGYTANGDVPSIVVTPSSTSGLDKVVTYVANEGSQTIIYVDENGKKVGQQVVTGKTGDKVKVTPEIPSGYESNDKLPKEVTIKAKDEPLIVKVIEKIPEVNPDQNVTDDDSNKNINQESTPEQSSEDTSKDTESHEVKTDNKKNHTISVQEKHSDHKKLGEKLTVTTKSESKLRTASSKHLEKMSTSTLPQTGEGKDFLSIMGLVATALSGVFGFGLKKKKKE